MSIGNINGLYILLVVVTLLAIVLVVAALVSIAPAVFNLGQTMEDTFQGFVTEVESFALIAINQVGRVTATLANSIESVINTFNGGIAGALNQLDSQVDSLFRQINGGLVQVTNVVGSIAQSLFTGIAALGGKLLSAVEDIGYQLAGRVLVAAIGVIQTVLRFLAPLIEFVRDIRGWIRDFILNPITDILGPVLGQIGDAAKTIIGLLQSISPGGILSSLGGGSGILNAVSGIGGFLGL